MSKRKKSSVIAISEKDFNDFGCSGCGSKEGHDSVTSSVVRVHKCSACGVVTHILAEGVTASPVSVSGGIHFPSLTKHPLANKGGELS